MMCDFLRENPMLWDIKKTDYRRVDKKEKLWQDQANAMGRSVQHLNGWFKSLRDAYTRLNKKKSGDGAPDLTEREHWVKENFGFLKTAVRHRAEPVRSVKATIAAHSGDLKAAEAACADIVIDDITPPSDPSTSAQRKTKRGMDDDKLLQPLQQRIQESGQLIKGLAQPQAVTANSAFANYVRDSLISMPKRKFQKARSRINTIISELMEEESDEEVSQGAFNFPAQTSTYARNVGVPATCTLTTSDMYANLCIQQPMSSLYQQPQHMMFSTPGRGLQPFPQIPLESSSTTVSAALGSAAKVLNQSPSALYNSSQSFSNISGLSGILNMTGSICASSIPNGELNTPPSKAN